MPRLIPLAAGTLLCVVTRSLVRANRARSRAERLSAGLLETLLRAIDANDEQTGQHVRRVATYALILADAAELSEHEQRSVERVALFHDIGKIDAALFDLTHDATQLSEAERDAIATHPRRGADVLAPLTAFYPTLADGVLSHHERWDGGGYPRGLGGDQIPIAARIVALADTFDAITFRRRYSVARTTGEAARAIAEASGGQFDPRLASLFLSPPVFERVERAMGADSPRIRTAPTRREPDAPDVEFRWRSMTSPTG